MPFRFAIAAAYFLIAAVGGRSPPPAASLGTSVSPSSPRAASLPMMRRAESHTASIAPIISCLPVRTSSSRHSNLRRHARIDQPRVGAPENPEQDEPPFRRHDVLALRRQEPLLLQPGDDFRPRRRRADPLRFLQPLAQGRHRSTKRQAFCIASISVPSL